MAHLRLLDGDGDGDGRPTVPKLVYARTPWSALEIPFGLRKARGRASFCVART
jgi:hypothetical protein